MAAQSALFAFTTLKFDLESFQQLKQGTHNNCSLRICTHGNKRGIHLNIYLIENQFCVYADELRILQVSSQA